MITLGPTFKILLLSFRSSLYILDFNSFSDMNFATFSPILWMILSTLLVVSFDAQKFYSWVKSICLLFFCGLCLWYHIQKTIAKSNVMKLFSFILSSKSIRILALTFKSLVHFKLIFVGKRLR